MTTSAPNFLATSRRPSTTSHAKLYVCMKHNMQKLILAQKCCKVTNILVAPLAFDMAMANSPIRPQPNVRQCKPHPLLLWSHNHITLLSGAGTTETFFAFAAISHLSRWCIQFWETSNLQFAAWTGVTGRRARRLVRSSTTEKQHSNVFSKVVNSISRRDFLAAFKRYYVCMYE